MIKKLLSLNVQKEGTIFSLKRLKKGLFPTIVISSLLLFSGCGGSSDSGNTDTNEENKAPVINTSFENISIDDNTTQKLDINISDVDGDSLTLSINTNNSKLSITPNFINPIVQGNYDGKTLDFNVTSDYNSSALVRVTLTLSDNNINASASFDVNITNTVSGIFQSGDMWKGLEYNTTTSPHTSKVWLDRNLGASQVCTAFNDASCYGDLYQWGRNTDGHEKTDSNISSIQATSLTDTGSNFIKANGNLDYDWAKALDSNGSIRSANWLKTDGTSVCPIGFRVPTVEELSAETI